VSLVRKACSCPRAVQILEDRMDRFEKGDVAMKCNGENKSEA
jgi:hypothetical protein